jgi:hypothetical protein
LADGVDDDSINICDCFIPSKTLVSPSQLDLFPSIQWHHEAHFRLEDKIWLFADGLAVYLSAQQHSTTQLGQACLNA